MKNGFNLESLQRAYDDIALEFALIYAQTNELLNEYFEQRKIQRSFPIDYADSAISLGMKVCLDDLNYFHNKDNSYIIGKLVTNREYNFAVDYRTDMSLMRYVICYETVAYLCNFEKDEANIYKTSILPCGENSFVIEAFTAFLVLPPDMIFKDIDDYIKSNSLRIIDREELIKHLSKVSQIPQEKIVTNLEYIKFLFSYLRTSSGKKRLREAFKRNYNNHDKKLSKSLENILEKDIIVPKYFFD